MKKDNYNTQINGCVVAKFNIMLNSRQSISGQKNVHSYVAKHLFIIIMNRHSYSFILLHTYLAML